MNSVDPINTMWCHDFGDILLPTVKTNTLDELPICQDKFGYVGCNHLWSHGIHVYV